MKNVKFGSIWEFPSAPMLGELKVKNWMLDAYNEKYKITFELWDGEAELTVSDKILLQKAVLVKDAE